MKKLTNPSEDMIAPVTSQHKATDYVAPNGKEWRMELGPVVRG